MPELNFNTGAITGMDFKFQGSLWRANPKAVDDVIQTELRALGANLVQWIHDHGPVDTSVSVQSARYDIFPHGRGDYELVISAQAPQAYWSLEAGRGSGGYPPLDKILGWVTRRQATSKQQRGVRAVGRVIGRSYKGGVVPVTAPFEKGMGPHSGSGLDRLGDRKGKSFARKSAFPDRIAQATAEFSLVTKEDVNIAYAIMYSIARRGSRSKPRVFSRLLVEADWALDKALEGIRKGLTEVLASSKS